MICRIFYLYFFISFISCFTYNDDNVNLLRWLSNAARGARAAQNTTSNETTTSTTATKNCSEITNNIDVNQSAIINSRNVMASERYRSSASNSIRALLEVLEQNAQNMLKTINEMNNIVGDQEKELEETEEEENEQEQQEETSAPPDDQNDKNCETIENTETKGSTNQTSENYQCEDCVENPTPIETNNGKDTDNNNGIDLCEQQKKLEMWNKQIAICKELLKNTKSVLSSDSNGEDNDGENVGKDNSIGSNSGSSDDIKNEVIVPNVAILSPLKSKLIKIDNPPQEQNLQNDSELRSNSNAAPITSQRWTEWSTWTPCSVSCGIGKQVRFRKCSGPSCRADVEIDEKACHQSACGKQFLRTFKLN